MLQLLHLNLSDRIRKAILPLCLLFAGLSAAGQEGTSIRNQQYLVLPKSMLKLEGSTNVNAFSCNCTEQFKPQTIGIVTQPAINTAFFSATSLTIPVKSLDCGNKLMNRDMYKALNAEKYPMMKIEVIKVIRDDGKVQAVCGSDWTPMLVQARISINGKSNEYWLSVSGRVSFNHYRFRGNKSFTMTEFNVTPPVAMMGMVKVRNEIRINFDLYVDVF